MTGPIDHDPLEQLRHADPARPDELPSASLARVRARVDREIALMESQEPSRRSSQLRPALGALVVAVVAVAAIAIAWPRGVAPGTVGPGATPPTVAVASATPASEPSGGPPIVGPGAASCVEPYSLSNLPHRTIGFDGTVTATSGDEATFRVNVAYRGVTGGTITLTAMGMTGSTITSAGGPTLTVGNRYLVAGEDRFAWPCGYTQPYDPSVATAWASAFGH